MRGGENTNKNKLQILFCVLLVALLICSASTLSFFSQAKTKYVNAVIGFGFDIATIHTQITIYKGSELILSQNHPGNVTNLGDNMTIYKQWGDSDFQYGALNSSAYTPFISIGNLTGTNLNNTSTVLPEEWHRELATIDGEQQSQLNFSCTISGGDITGTQVADCIGVCLTETDDANDLWGFDTFTQVTGIDNTFTINVDIQVSDSHTT